MMMRTLHKREGYLRVELNSFTINTLSNRLIRSNTKYQNILESDLFERTRRYINVPRWDLEYCDKYDWNYSFEKGIWLFGRYYGNIKVVIYEYKPTPKLRAEREKLLIERERERKREQEYRERYETIKQLKAEYPDYIKTSFSKDKPKVDMDPEKAALYEEFMDKYRDEMFNSRKFLPTCPNCGANNWENGRCTYCGTKII